MMPARPRLGVLATHAIQYQAPLYQELSRRSAVDLEVALLSDAGARPFHNADFGAAVTWDIDLLGGYRWTLLDHRSPRALAGWPFRLIGWLRRQDIVVLHGHADPRMLLAATACRALRTPYLLRGESHAEPAAAGWRRLVRHALASFTVRGAAGALPIGQLNAAFYQRYGRIPLFGAPYSVDNDRFRTVAGAARGARTKRLSSLGLDPGLPVVIFSGKLIARKRPLDVVRAVERCAGRLSLLLLGDGPLREEVRSYEGHLPVRCVGFVNQADLPAWYACGDVLVLPSGGEPWGVVVNEGMACGLVPVVSDAVGCAPDLVEGVGELFAVGDVGALAAALLRAAQDAPGRREKIPARLDRFGITETALGYERATLALYRRRD
jgi:glycosyltransferase involved in cell wall biosynthesis